MYSQNMEWSLKEYRTPGSGMGILNDLFVGYKVATKHISKCAKSFQMSVRKFSSYNANGK